MGGGGPKNNRGVLNFDQKIGGYNFFDIKYRGVWYEGSGYRTIHSKFLRGSCAFFQIDYIFIDIARCTAGPRSSRPQKYFWSQSMIRAIGRVVKN